MRPQGSCPMLGSSRRRKERSGGSQQRVQTSGAGPVASHAQVHLAPGTALGTERLLTGVQMPENESRNANCRLAVALMNGAHHGLQEYLRS